MVSTLPEARFFRTNSSQELWQRYCGFLDISLDEFKAIQNYLLLEQIKLVADTPLGRKIMRKNRPASVEEFRRVVPVTRYEDYAPYLGKRREYLLAESTSFWCHSAGRGGNFKWIPYTKAAFDSVAQHVIGVAILASAGERGAVHLTSDARVLVNLAPRPYASGSLMHHFTGYLPYRPIPPLAQAEEPDFRKRTKLAFRLALEEGIDYILSTSSVLTKIGDSFSGEGKKLNLSSAMLHPRTLLRLSYGWLRSQLACRQILPRDLWSTKGLVIFGVDSALHEGEIARSWGKVPFQVYGTTEIMIGAMQSWNKKAMTFLPDVAFWEFIPQSEWQRSKEDPSYQPATVLIDELEPENQYELVFSHFYGMPLLRYRIGDVFKVVASEDLETGVKLPQVLFQSRASDIIDLAGLTQIDERTLSKAMANAGVTSEYWCALREHSHGHVCLRLLLELEEERPEEELETLLESQLRTVDMDYRDLEGWLGQGRAVRVTLLSPGTFASYFEEKLREGASVAELRPARINPPDSFVARLLQISETRHGKR